MHTDFPGLRHDIENADARILTLRTRLSQYQHTMDALRELHRGVSAMRRDFELGQTLRQQSLDTLSYSGIHNRAVPAYIEAMGTLLHGNDATRASDGLAQALRRIDSVIEETGLLIDQTTRLIGIVQSDRDVLQMRLKHMKSNTC